MNLLYKLELSLYKATAISLGGITYFTYVAFLYMKEHDNAKVILVNMYPLVADYYAHFVSQTTFHVVQ